MKKAVFAAIVCVTAQVFAWQPQFQEYETISIGGTEFKDLPIDLVGNGNFNGYPAPNFVDYNGDGLRDLVIGLFDYGSIMVSENVGTQSAPAFDDYYILQNEERGPGFARPM